MKTAREIFPDHFKDRFDRPSGYGPIVSSFGTVLAEVTDDNCSGDTRALLQSGDKFAVLVFGWGSCSGCDALQGCRSYEEVDELIRHLAPKEWLSRDEVLKYLREHDWAGDYRAQSAQDFAKAALNAMEAAHG